MSEIKITVSEAPSAIMVDGKTWKPDAPPNPDVTEKPKIAITTPNGSSDNVSDVTIAGTIDPPNVGQDILLNSPPTVLGTFKAAADCKWSWTGKLKDIGLWIIHAHATNSFGTSDSNPVQFQVFAQGGGGNGGGGGTDAPPAPQTRIAAGADRSAIQAAVNNCPAGGSVVFAPGAYTIGGTVRLKAGVCVWADGVVTLNGGGGAGTAGAFDGGGLADWTIAGKAPGQGFVFNFSLVNATSARNFVVACAKFNNQASNGYDGSAVRMNGADGGTIVNNDFTGCQGNVLGMYNLNAIMVDGCTFLNCRQPISYQFATDGSNGNDMSVLRNTFEGTTRAAMEMGPDSNKAQSMNRLKVNDNWFDRFANAGGGDAWAMLPISLVAQAAKLTEVKNNYICRGPVTVKIDAPAIEVTGPGECTGNVNDGFTWDGFTYQSGWNVHHNSGYLNPWGWTNNGHGSGTFANNTNLPSKPPVKPKPTRIAASSYYPWNK